MFINFKQKELIKELVKEIQKHFSEVEFINVTPGAENPNELWVHVTTPEDEDREIELMEFSAKKTGDILLDYGYSMLVMPIEKPNENSDVQDIESLIENGSSATILNFKQDELIEKLMKDIRKKFSEVELINITTSPENPNELWIRVTTPEDEDREIELMEFSAKITTEILLDYGYSMLVMPVDRQQESGVVQKKEVLAAIG